MRLASLVGHTRELLAEILEKPAYPADATINYFFRNRKYLGTRDRAFIAEHTYGVLRNILRYSYLFSEMVRSGSLNREVAVALTAYLMEEDTPGQREEFLEGTRLPSRDADKVRQILSEKEQIILSLREPLRSAVEYGMPEWFVERLQEQNGEEETKKLLRTLNQQAPITLRANTLVTTPQKLITALELQEIPIREAKYSHDALHLRKRLNANAVPEFKQGWFELQDEGSQLLSQILDPHPNWKVFDACAGAGGKTLHMAAIMKGKGEVVAHDINERRLGQLRPRLKRSAAQNVRIMEHEQYIKRRDTLLGAYDAVLIDAPCTGAGVLRRNPGGRLSLLPDTLERVTQLQAEILDEYSPLVKPGGTMLYATCSVLREENEEMVEAFLKRNPQWKKEVWTSVPEGMLTEHGYFRCNPYDHGTDGFFGAMLRKIS